MKEAEKRGLANVKTTPHALDAMGTKKAFELFEKMGIYTHRELEARHEIELENYTKKIQIESRIMGDLAMTKVVPAALAFQEKLTSAIQQQKALGISDKVLKPQVELASEIAERIGIILTSVTAMVDARRSANKADSARTMAIEYCEKVKPFFDTIRYQADKLELRIDDELWPLPKYRELLFLK